MMWIRDCIMFYVVWFILRWIFGIKDCLNTDSTDMADEMNIQATKSNFKSWLFWKLVKFKKTAPNEYTIYIKYFHQDVD